MSHPLITGTSSDQAKKATQRFQLFSAKILADIITPSREEGAAMRLLMPQAAPTTQEFV